MISVVVPAYNAAATISACVQALKRQKDVGDDYEIIVVDNGSVDNTAQLALNAGATVIQQPKRGAAAARNAGIQRACGDVVCFTDADCVPHDTWLKAIIAPLADNEVIGCKGVYTTEQSSLVARFVQIEYEDKYDRLRQQAYIDFIDTYSAAYRRQVLLTNGCFDEQFFFVEDQELSFRLATRGYKMVFQPQAAVCHLHSDTFWRYFRKKFSIGYWKAQVIRRFPTRGISDSHTPQVLKVQIALTAVFLASLVLPLPTALFAPAQVQWAFVPALSVLLLFIFTTLPFVAKAWPKDTRVALASPLLLATRALALGAGYAVSLLHREPHLGGANEAISGLNYVGKRTMDIVGSLLGLVATAVCAPFIALSIKLDSPGPVIFRQERIGQEGRPFTVYKFRSMKTGAEENLSQLIDLDQLPEPAFKLKDDPRLTRVGRILRRWSLDELPQFWNVLKGDMSLIGPRPEESPIVARYNDWHRRRLAVKPGLTGPMQVNGRGDLPLDTRVRLEIEYIENYSLRRDLVILWQTIPAVIKGTGAR
jgi:lipopolysaccharide/colanic/teichoic acid biosynthesis glycosyltransferase/GT2 family glycosyltransferase